MKFRLSLFLFVLTFCCSVTPAAAELVSYAGIDIHRAAVSIDEFGATAVEDKTTAFGIFAASRLYKNLYLEYGYKDLGEYTADYDFTVGSFRLVEAHKVDFSSALYAGLVVKASVGEIMEGTDLHPVFNRIYLHAAVGGVYWQARLEMNGSLYDSGTLLSPYGATADDDGFSHYYEFGLGYLVSEKLILSLTMSTYADVGKGMELQQFDGTRKEYAGMNVDTVGLGLVYMF